MKSRGDIFKVKKFRNVPVLTDGPGLVHFSFFGIVLDGAEPQVCERERLLGKCKRSRM